jgi:hypothetical protein
MSTAWFLVVDLLAVAIACISLDFLRRDRDLFNCTANPEYGQYAPALGLCMPLTGASNMTATSTSIPQPRTPS